MTLKELRISKGLTQEECAKYLGTSPRNYQNYENNPKMVNTVKYNAFYNKLNAYSFGNAFNESNTPAYYTAFNTNVVIGSSLSLLVSRTAKFQKRDCYKILKQFIEKDVDGKIAILYGLRRTGKTTLLFQAIGELPLDQTAYIKIKTTDNMSMLTKDLDALNKKGCKYVFIDEVTLMDDFIGTAALLSDIFATMGMKIVVSGTDSLGFAMANRDELYDRNVMIHTSFISFREYSRLLGIKSVDTYIEYGGTLKMENMGFDDPEFSFDEVSFRDDESTRKYIDTAISRNIQHTLKNDSFGKYFNQLQELYEKGELTNVINRIIESMNHQFLLSVIQEEFKSHDLGSAKELLLHEFPAETANVLYDVDEKQIVERLKALINIKETSELKIPITEEHVNKIKKYLFMLDLIIDCTEVYETRGQGRFTVFIQPGMRYAIAKALVYSLMQDEFFASRPESDKDHIIEKILEDVKGRMMEDIVLLETSKVQHQNQEVFKFKFDAGGEFDMVIYDREKNSCRLFEIKHSEQMAKQQTKNLRNENMLKIAKHRFGNIEGRYVIYRGLSQPAGDIQYLNVEDYLRGL